MFGPSARKAMTRATRSGFRQFSQRARKKDIEIPSLDRQVKKIGNKVSRLNREKQHDLLIEVIENFEKNATNGDISQLIHAIGKRDFGHYKNAVNVIEKAGKNSLVHKTFPKDTAKKIIQGKKKAGRKIKALPGWVKYPFIVVGAAIIESLNPKEVMKDVIKVHKKDYIDSFFNRRKSSDKGDFDTQEEEKQNKQEVRNDTEREAAGQGVDNSVKKEGGLLRRMHRYFGVELPKTKVSPTASSSLKPIDVRLIKDKNREKTTVNLGSQQKNTPKF